MANDGLSEIVIADLQPGDVIRHKSRAKALIVTANYGDRVTAVRTYDITNPSEWMLVAKGAFHGK